MIEFLELSEATVIMVLATVSCDYVTSCAYDGKKTWHVVLTCGIYPSIFAYTKNYLQSDWLRGVQY